MITTATPWRYACLIFRFFLAIVFLVAGGSKIMHSNEFVDTVRSYSMLPSDLVRPFALALPWIEVLLGLYLLVGLFTRVAAACSGLLLVMFLVALGVQIAHGHTGNCGCVLGVDNPIVTAFLGGNDIGYWDLIRDSLLLLMAVAVALTPRQLLSVDALLAAHREADSDLPLEQEIA